MGKELGPSMQVEHRQVGAYPATSRRKPGHPPPETRATRRRKPGHPPPESAARPVGKRRAVLPDE
jgi:hypothetical protein